MDARVQGTGRPGSPPLCPSSRWARARPRLKDPGPGLAFTDRCQKRKGGQRGDLGGLRMGVWLFSGAREAVGKKCPTEKQLYPSRFPSRRRPRCRPRQRCLLLLAGRGQLAPPDDAVRFLRSPSAEGAWLGGTWAAYCHGDQKRSVAESGGWELDRAAGVLRGASPPRRVGPRLPRPHRPRLRPLSPANGRRGLPRGSVRGPRTAAHQADGVDAAGGPRVGRQSLRPARRVLRSACGKARGRVSRAHACPLHHCLGSRPGRRLLKASQGESRFVTEPLTACWKEVIRKTARGAFSRVTDQQPSTGEDLPNGLGLYRPATVCLEQVRRRFFSWSQPELYLLSETLARPIPSLPTTLGWLLRSLQLLLRLTQSRRLYYIWDGISDNLLMCGFVLKPTAGIEI
ncbi:uncharacterized protein LOC132657108 [Meriones unguiculatus]|uniref:uncharacterized protein LOC132657108 n=1 Tax=Meriones unguiculatus TaxID=10047 RepID=UPI00293F64CE|nr:uncharacterized protein LOC132657108 [Meriones unguiculatus]